MRLRRLLLLSASLLAFAPPAQKKTTWQELRAREYQYTFDEYLAEYRKTYVGAAYDARRRIFEDALATIREHNENSGAAWKMGLSPHSDRTEEEWRALKGLKHIGTPPEGGVEASGRGGLLGRTAWGDLPDSVDWREKGVVSAVKNQQSCGSCWAFAATETVESAVAIATGTLPILAPQQYVDCAPNPEHCGGTGGCAGSTQWLAFNYTLGVGLTASADYPYDARDGVCHAAPAVAGITGYKRLPSNDYGALMHAVATVGPIAISVDASWQVPVPRPHPRPRAIIPSCALLSSRLCLCGLPSACPTCPVRHWSPWSEPRVHVADVRGGCLRREVRHRYRQRRPARRLRNRWRQGLLARAQLVG